jgi:Flp pilus assembly protein TadG
MQKRLLKDCSSGTAMIEFGLVLPLLMLMLLGTIEISRFAILNQKVDKVANSMADFVTQGTSVSGANLSSFATAATEIMKPYSYTGTIVFSSVSFINAPVGSCNTVGAVCITWQCKKLGGGASKIGGQGGNATLPGGYTVSSGQDVIVAEAVFDYTPFVSLTGTLIPALAPRPIYKAAIYKPRQGLLNSLTGGC